jgi:hypothetical protein
MIIKRLKEFWIWLFNLQDDKALPTAQEHILLRQFHITSKCRYNASIRLKRLGRGTFLTTILLSLGLILIPMLQLANLTIAYPTPVVNALQIFLAVAILVFSIVSATANHDARARVLNDCADRIKSLGTELRTAIQANQVDLKAFSDRYSGITRDSEMHSRADYALAKLQATEQYAITGIARVWTRATVIVMETIPYLPSVALLTIEGILVVDLLGITSIWTPFMLRLAAQ